MLEQHLHEHVMYPMYLLLSRSSRPLERHQLKYGTGTRRSLQVREGVFTRFGRAETY